MLRPKAASQSRNLYGADVRALLSMVLLSCGGDARVYERLVIRCLRKYRRRLFLSCDSGVSEGLFIAAICTVYIAVGIVCLRAIEEDEWFNAMDEAGFRRCLHEVTTSSTSSASPLSLSYHTPLGHSRHFYTLSEFFFLKIAQGQLCIELLGDLRRQPRRVVGIGYVFGTSIWFLSIHIRKPNSYSEIYAR